MQDLKIWLGIFWLLLLLSAMTSIVIWSMRNGISPMPTSTKVKRLLLGILPSQIQGQIYELGAGWGTLIFPLARYYPNCQVIGFETSPFPYWFSRLRHWWDPLPNITLRRTDFFAIPLNEAALVVCYLYPAAMKQLADKFAEELPPGTWVITHTFAIPHWSPLAVYSVGDLYRSQIYVYRV